MSNFKITSVNLTPMNLIFYSSSLKYQTIYPPTLTLTRKGARITIQFKNFREERLNATERSVAVKRNVSVMTDNIMSDSHPQGI